MPQVCVEVTGIECRECFNVEKCIALYSAVIMTLEKCSFRLDIEYLLITVQGTTSGLN